MVWSVELVSGWVKGWDISAGYSILYVKVARTLSLGIPVPCSLTGMGGGQ